MDNALWKKEHNYRGGEFAVEYCGGCQFADHTGNQFTCNKAEGMTVRPGDVCDLFRVNGDHEGVVEMDAVSAYPPEIVEGRNRNAGDH